MLFAILCFEFMSYGTVSRGMWVDVSLCSTKGNMKVHEALLHGISQSELKYRYRGILATSFLCDVTDEHSIMNFSEKPFQNLVEN